MSAVRDGDIDRGDEFGLTPAGFLYCALCGALLLEGYQETHRRRCLLAELIKAELGQLARNWRSPEAFEALFRVLWLARVRELAP